MSTINDRIEQLISHFTKGNKRAFAIKSGLAPTVLENIVGKRGGKPSFDVLEKIVCAFATINANWLITGSGSMEKEHFNYSSVSEPIIGYNTTESERIQELKATIKIQNDFIALLKSQIPDQDATGASVADAS